MRLAILSHIVAFLGAVPILLSTSYARDASSSYHSLPDSLEIALRSGTVDRGTYLSQQLYRRFAPERVDSRYTPPGYRLSREKCFTDLLYSLVINRAELTQEAQTLLDEILSRIGYSDRIQSLTTHPATKGARPDDQYFPDTLSTAHFMIHYNLDPLSANPLPLDDENDNDVYDILENIELYSEEVYNLIIGDLGYPNNYDGVTGGGADLYDIYVVNIGHYGYASRDNLTAHTTTGYFSVGTWLSGQDAELMSVTVAHEFLHVIQFGIDALEWSMWLEACSTWMENVAYDDIDDYVQYLNMFFYNVSGFNESTYPVGQRWPIEDDGGPFGAREYGALIWPMFLVEKHGNGVIKDIWNQCNTTSTKNFMSSTQTVLANSYSSSLQDALNEFAIQVYCTSKGLANHPEAQHRPVTTMPAFEFNDRSASWDDRTWVWTKNVTSIGAGTEVQGLTGNDGKLWKRGRTYVRLASDALPTSSEYVQMDFTVQNPTSTTGFWNVQICVMDNSGNVERYGPVVITTTAGGQSTETLLMGNEGSSGSLREIFVVVTQPINDDAYLSQPASDKLYRFDINMTKINASISTAITAQAGGDIPIGSFYLSGNVSTASDLTVTNVMRLVFTGNTTWSGEDIVVDAGGKLSMPASYTLTLNRTLELASGATVDGLDGHVIVNSGGKIKLATNSTFVINDDNSRYITLGASGIIEGASKTSSTVEGGRIAVTGNGTSINNVTIEWPDEYGTGYADVTYTNVASGTLSDCIVDAGGGEAHSCIAIYNSTPTIQNNELNNGDYCVYVNGANPTIKDNVFGNATYAVYLSSASPNIYRNEFSNADRAIYAYDNSDPIIHTDAAMEYDCPSSVNNVFNTTCTRALYAYLSSEFQGGRENDYEGGGNNFLKANASSGVHLYASNTGLQELEWNYWNGGADYTLAGGATVTTSPGCSQFSKPARNREIVSGIGADIESALTPLAERDTTAALENLRRLLVAQTDAANALIALDYLAKLVPTDDREGVVSEYENANYSEAVRQAAAWATARNCQINGNYVEAVATYAAVREFPTESLLSVEALFAEANVRRESLNDPDGAAVLYQAFIETASEDNPNRSIAEKRLSRLGSDPQTKETALTPEDTPILSAEPNPFNPSTTMTYRVDAAGAVRVGIYAVSGQLIHTLVNETREPGTHAIIWDGNDASGRQVASGVYLVRLTTPTRAVTHRVTMVR